MPRCEICLTMKQQEVTNQNSTSPATTPLLGCVKRHLGKTATLSSESKFLPSFHSRHSSFNKLNLDYRARLVSRSSQTFSPLIGCEWPLRRLYSE